MLYAISYIINHSFNLSVYIKKIYSLKSSIEYLFKISIYISNVHISLDMSWILYIDKKIYLYLLLTVIEISGGFRSPILIHNSHKCMDAINIINIWIKRECVGFDKEIYV